MAKSKINAEISLKTNGTGKVVAEVNKVTESVKKSTGFIGDMKKFVKDMNSEVQKSYNPFKQLNGVLGVMDERFAALSKYEKTVKRGVTAVSNEVKHLSAGVVGGLGMLAGGTFGAVKGVISLADGVASQADTLAKFGRNVGMSAGQLQQWQYAAQRGGMSAEGMNNALKKFASNASKAANGEKAQLAIFNAMGVRLKDNRGNLKSTSQLMLDVADAYNKIKSSQDKIRLTEELFGRGNYGIQNVFEGGSSAVNDLLARRERLGGMFSEEDSKNAEAFKDILLDVQTIVDGIKTKFVVEMLPSLNQGLTEFIDVWDKNGGKILDKTKIAADVVGQSFIKLVELAGEWCNVLDQSDLIFSMTGDDIKFVLNEVFEEFKKLVRWWQDVPVIGDIIKFGKSVLTSGNASRADVAPAQVANPVVTQTAQTYTTNRNINRTSNVNINVTGANGSYTADADEAFNSDPNVSLNTGYVFNY